MKNKRILSLILSFFMLLTIPVGAFADDEFYIEEYYDEDSIEEVASEEEIYLEPFYEEEFIEELQDYITDDETVIDDNIADNIILEKQEETVPDDAVTEFFIDDTYAYYNPAYAFTKDLEDKSAAVGETVVFEVEAPGTVTYQWQYSTDSGKTWSNWGGNNGRTVCGQNVSLHRKQRNNINHLV